MPAANVRRAECAAFTKAGRDQDLGATAAAETALRAFRRDHPNSVLLPFTDERLAILDLQQVDAAITALDGETGDARRVTTKAAFETLFSVRRELGDAPSAARVPQVMQVLFAAVERPYREQRFCEVLPTLDYVVTLPPTEAVWIVATARSHQAPSLLGCGLLEFRAGHFAQARVRMQQLLDGHPGDGGEAQARSVLVAADVAEKTTDPIPVPAPLGSGGPRTLTYYNVTSTAVRVQITGATAVDITVAPCPSCPATQPPAIGACPSPDGKPTQTVQLGDGLYHALLSPESGVGSTVRAFTAVDGDHYCVFAVDDGPAT